LGKALGGGMPLGAFIADKKLMDLFTYNPVLGHINTFGGHPVSCAAGLSAFNVLMDENLLPAIKEKETLFLSLLQHPAIKAVRSCGLMIAVEFDSYETNKQLIDSLVDVNTNNAGVFTDWFLFASNCMRIAPPLVITHEEISLACQSIIKALDSF
jgi:acetylornithine/succinyldiaminopimelate/putrescine aminotransferase